MHLDVSTAAEEMADYQGQEKVEEQSATMEQGPAHLNAANMSKGEGLILESLPAHEPAAPIGVVAPDGGYKAWAAVVGGFLCQFASFGFLNV